MKDLLVVAGLFCLLAVSAVFIPSTSNEEQATRLAAPITFEGPAHFTTSAGLTVLNGDGAYRN